MGDIKSILSKMLSAAVGSNVSPDDIKPSPIADFGSPIAFKLAKESGENPAMVAANICTKLEADSLVSSAKAEGGYINFILDRIEDIDSLVRNTDMRIEENDSLNRFAVSSSVLQGEDCDVSIQ